MPDGDGHLRWDWNRLVDEMDKRLAAALEAGSVASIDVTDVHVFGGGSRSMLYVRCLAATTGRPVHPGPVEATALGNALVQGVALGCYRDLADARAHLEQDPS